MDDEFELQTTDTMSERAQAMCRLAATVDATISPDARMLLLKAMDALLYTINPPRGELKEIKKDG